MLAFWASHEHLGLFLSYSLAHLYTGIGALWCTYALFRSFRNLGLTDMFSSLFCYPHDILVSLFPLFVSFVPSCCLIIWFTSFFFIPRVPIFHISLHGVQSYHHLHSILWTLIQRSLVEKVILSVRVYIIVWELSISLCILIGAHVLILRLCKKIKNKIKVIHVIMYSQWSPCIVSDYTQKKKKKRKKKKKSYHVVMYSHWSPCIDIEIMH